MEFLKKEKLVPLKISEKAYAIFEIYRKVKESKNDLFFLELKNVDFRSE